MKYFKTRRPTLNISSELRLKQFRLCYNILQQIHFINKVTIKSNNLIFADESQVELRMKIKETFH